MLIRKGSAAAVISFCLIVVPFSARADFKVRSPVVEQEIEVEHNGAVTRDKDPAKSGARSYTVEVGASLTPWWRPELEFEIGRDPGERTRLRATTFENVFQLTDQEDYWASFGLYGEYARAIPGKRADAIEFGPLLQKGVGSTIHTLNLLFSKEIGPNHADSGYHVNYAWQSRWVWRQMVQPGVEIYGEPGRVDRIGALKDQEHRIGPVFSGNVIVGHAMKIKYEAGYLFGLTPGTSDGAVKWRLEFEVPF